MRRIGVSATRIRKRHADCGMPGSCMWYCHALASFSHANFTGFWNGRGRPCKHHVMGDVRSTSWKALAATAPG